MVREQYLPLLERVAIRALKRSTSIELVGGDWRAETQASGARPPPGTRPLNPGYTFDRFVIGDSNRFAHAAALAVAEMPAQAYSPLFLYGPSGVGKTHLLQAIGHYVRRYGLGLGVHYATVEDFTTEFVEAVRGGDIKAFKERFREVEVLLVDDIQFLEDRTRTKEEFFHTFNALQERGSQLVLSSDCPPAQMTELEPRLRERFQSGLVVELGLPGVAARTVMLRSRAQRDGLQVGDETLAEIAEHVSESVRALEGALTRVVAYGSLTGEPLTPSLARLALGRLYPRAQAGPPTIERIQEATAAWFGLRSDDLLAYGRQQHHDRARQVAMYLARQVRGEPFQVLGKAFGGRSHATVLKAHQRISGEIEHDTALRETIEALRRQLTNT